MNREIAPAKINLALHVRARRPDGYHDLETLFAFARDGDAVTVVPAEADGFTIAGPFAAALSPSPDNLVTRARDAFRGTFGGPPVAITLDKHLPIASGIGGGSADAAATLRALARLSNVAPDDPRLFAIAAALGADVPACLDGRTTFGTGKGEALTAVIGRPGTPLLLVNPHVAVSTPAVFQRWDGVDRGPLALEDDLLETARGGRNDLEAPAIALAPVIADVRAQLDAAAGVTLSRMSGSGATCFALFADSANRDAAAASARALGWWTMASELD